MLSLILQNEAIFPAGHATDLNDVACGATLRELSVGVKVMFTDFEEEAKRPDGHLRFKSWYTAFHFPVTVLSMLGFRLLAYTQNISYY